jgi:hypothetical protein
MKTNNNNNDNNKRTIRTFRYERSFSTDDIRVMKDMYLKNNIVKKWTENFIDEDTGEVVGIERNEILLSRGTLIDGDELQTIIFYKESGEIDQVEVTNQRRKAHEVGFGTLQAWKVKVKQMDKSVTIILYAYSLDNAYHILNDYLEQLFDNDYNILSIASMGNIVVLDDNFVGMQDKTDGGNKEKEKKFYDIEVVIKSEGYDMQMVRYIVNTYNSERAQFVIQCDLNRRKKDDNVKFEIMLEKINPMPSLVYIPRSFSEEYNNDEFMV